MPKLWSAEKSQRQLKKDASHCAKSTVAAWSCATKANIFLKKAKYVGSGKNKLRATTSRNGKVVPLPQRANRALRKASIKTLFSGAAESVARQMAETAQHLGIDHQGESRTAALLPGMTKGAELAFERVLIAYAKTLFTTAVEIKNSIGVHGKLTHGAAVAGCNIANSDIFANGLNPGKAVFLTQRKKTKRVPKGEKPEKEEREEKEDATPGDE